jgi:ABC-type transport system involved in multi-copper enzyme maturation permease subunit
MARVLRKTRNARLLLLVISTRLRQVAPMLDGKKLGVVARFELLEAVRSRLFIIVLTMYGAGAAIGSYAFLKVVEATEDAARHQLAASMHVDESQLPKDLLQEKALPMFANLIQDEELRAELLSMPPLSIFYGFMALNLVALLVLAISTGTMAADISSGAARFALFRCDRITWSTGKLLGQEALLAAGLSVGALVAGLVGMLLDSDFSAETWLWLLRTSFRAWLYGSAYLGLFVGVSLVARSALKARAFALFLWMGLGIAHSIVSAEFLNERLPYLSFLGVLFPAEHRQALWSPDWGSYLPAAGALLLIGVVGFSAGLFSFNRSDA